jgi:small subunit ribosomal protein S27Ae
MAKARVGLYSTKGEQLGRTHKFCPKCGPGTFLAEHADRRSCGKCGYSEPKTATATAPAPVPAKAKPAKAA